MSCEAGNTFKEVVMPCPTCGGIGGLKVVDTKDTFPCLHGCDSVAPSYPTFRLDRHVKPCPHAKG